MSVTGRFLIYPTETTTGRIFKSRYIAYTHTNLHKSIEKFYSCRLPINACMIIIIYHKISVFTYCVLKCKTQIHFSSIFYERRFYLTTIRVKFAVRNGAKLATWKYSRYVGDIPTLHRNLAREAATERDKVDYVMYIYAIKTRVYSTDGLMS